MKFGEKKDVHQDESMCTGGTRMCLAGGHVHQVAPGEESFWVFYGTCMVFMMLQDVICVIILI
jgi:hypothetical protein